MKPLNIFYAGDSPVGGAANYLLGVMKSLKAKACHVDPGTRMTPRFLKKFFDVIVLSDFSRSQMPLATQKVIASQVKDGAGFMMVGGWGSFSGPFGGWRGSYLEDHVLPVVCSAKDDRISFPGGAQLLPKQNHLIFESISFVQSPVIVGMNEIYPKLDSSILISAKKIVTVRAQLMLDPTEHPLLVVDSNPQKRVAAFTSDFAPHWCGGLIDWGSKLVKLAVAPRIHIQVGKTYLQFVSSLILWLAGKR